MMRGASGRGATGRAPIKMAGRGAKDAIGTAKRLLRYMGNYKWILVAVAALIIVSALAGVQGSLFLETLIDDYITPMIGIQNPDFAPLFQAILMMAGLYALGIGASYLYARLMVIISQGVQKSIREQLFASMQYLSIKYFDTHAHGDVMSRYTNDIDTLRQMLSQSVPQAFSSLLTVVFVFGAMVMTNWILTIIVVACIVGILTLSGKLAGMSGKYFVAQQQSLGKANGYIEEMMHGQKVVKVFTYEDKAREKFDVLNEELCANATKANGIANILMPLLMNLGNVQYALIALSGGLMAVNGIGGLTLGSIAAFLQLSRSFNQPVNQISQQLNSVIMALAGAERIFELMDEPHEVDEGYVTLVHAHIDEKGNISETEQRTGHWAWKHPHQDGSVTFTQLSGDVRFTDVDFSYDGEKTVLHDVSLYAKPGQKIAFVGATGAGKTTITNLINRFYDVQDGKIHYDGINIGKIKKADLRRSLGMVLQDTVLFTGTIRENIRYGRLNATDEEVEAAAELANAHGFIQRLPEGYDTMITGDGSGLSQGQRQLLSIARAAVANPPVMILDEATSSIDSRTEAIVQRGMDRLMQGRTVFVIAHRLSTIKNANAIMVMEDGRIIERGDHDQLLAERGKYYQLYTGMIEVS